MPVAKKLPSGSWRCQVFSHFEDTVGRDGKVKKKRKYKSFTCDDPSRAGKTKAEKAALDFLATRDKPGAKKRMDACNMTLSQAIDKYIENRKTLNRSITTIEEYECTRKTGFQDLMTLPLKDIDEVILQEAINMESRRPNLKSPKTTISAKRLKNEWGLVRAAISKYRKDLPFEDIELPKVIPRVVELPSAQQVLAAVRGTTIELAVLLAMWLSFSMSEVLGLTKSKSISSDGQYLTIREVIVTTRNGPYRKEIAKNETRNRRHRIPEYIRQLIDKVEGDALVPITGNALYRRWIRIQDANGLDHITFHDLRHLSASIMALLRVPDKYAQERGGWKSDQVMKKIYMQTFSESRIAVDDMIDDYFISLMQHEMQHGTKKSP